MAGCAGSGTGDTGDALLKQTRSPPPAPPSGREHAFASGRTRGRPGRPPAGPAPPARGSPTLPRVPSAASSPPPAPLAAPAPRGPRTSWPPCAPTSPLAPRAPGAAFCAAFAFGLETLAKQQGGRIPLRPLNPLPSTASTLRPAPQTSQSTATPAPDPAPPPRTSTLQPIARYAKRRAGRLG